MLKRFILQGYMLCCLIFALPILIENKAKAFEDTITVICGAFALQGLIHITGLLITSVGEFIFSLHRMETQLAAENTAANVARFRFYSLTGSPFFELPAAYGVSCIMFFRMQLMSGQNYLKGWKAFVLMFLILSGISLSGRTGFTGFSLGLLLYVFFSWNNFSRIWRNMIKIAGGFLILLIGFHVILTPYQQDQILNKVFPFAFEAYYNWRDTGKFNTSSTDELMEVHYYPIDTETMMWGKGTMSGEGTGYRYTDAGYMNNIIYGGILYLLLLAIYQFLYFRQPMKLCKLQNSQDGNIDFYCFFLLFVYMFILEYKGPTLGSQHITEVLLLYIGFSYIIKQYALEDEEDKNELAEEMIV
jgi:hypothetical protein